ncbi:MAG: acyloxyacyl hydrolase [Pseudomonadota bacterium]|nr:acyloxyacyl hydrolase [Pseudomonadota bacterium]
MKLVLAACGCAAAIASTPASAQEIFGGLYKHDVKTPLVKSGNIEDGADIMVGWRGGRIGATPLQPYVYGALNTAGDTSYAAAGLSAKFGGQLYIRPGLGIAIHTGSSAGFENPFNDKVEFGSRVLFAPELGIGVQFSPRTSAELSFVHLSHAQLRGGQNPGLDNIGVRVNFAF